jgi:nucleolar protein 56
LGLAHTFSRNKIALDVNRQDKPIIQSISLLELLDKDINTFCMRVKEWYSWHFPELARIVADNYIFVKLVALVGDRATSTASLEEIEGIIGDGELAERVIETSHNSMGQEISEFDIQCLKELCVKTLRMFEFRTEIQGYLKGRMEVVAPNLTSLIGESIAAKLISHSGSLSTLSKYPASTIQILGAEKALFRALKQKTKTPKYGLLYNTTFIGRAMGKNKGKISRYLANKCAMAARLDNFLVNVPFFLYSPPTDSVKN